VPSICFSLLSVDEEALECAEQMSKSCENLIKQAASCQNQLRKDRLFDLMNTIKFCELDEYEERKNTNLDYEIVLKNIKCEIDSLNLQNKTYFGDDMKMLIEYYEQCCKRLNQLIEKSQIKGKIPTQTFSFLRLFYDYLFEDERNKFESKLNSDVECLEMKLKYLHDKFSQMERTEKPKQLSHMDYIEKLIAQYQVRN
jgi:hypothetical protein